MRWEQYQALCDQPSVLTRWLIEQTIRVCDPECARSLHSILRAEPITKPTGHKGGLATDMFPSSLDREIVVRIVEQVRVAIELGVKTGSPIERDYSSIERTWLEYLEWCADATEEEAQG